MRFTPGGVDLHSLPTRHAELARERLGDGWHPDHPETSAAWPCWQLWLSAEGRITVEEIDRLYPEQVADALEALAVARDVGLARRVESEADRG